MARRDTQRSLATRVEQIAIATPVAASGVVTVAGLATTAIAWLRG